MADVFERNVHCLLGLPFDAVDTAGAVRRVRDAALRREPCFLSTPNVNWLVACLADEAFRDSVIRSDLSIVDGMPLVWIAGLLGIPTRERVAGSEVFEKLRRDRTTRLSVFFFGGQAGVAHATCAKINADSGGITCVGFHFPGFGSVEEMSSDETIRRINASSADFVVVALGAKKGQAWIERNRARLSAPVISHLGAVVDFVAGRVSRAPVWIQRTGFEWLWRIKEQPGLWQRYLSDGLVLLRLLVTRVLPYAWFMYWHKPSRQELDSAAIDFQDTGDEIVIRLRGAWVQTNMRPLRDCFSKAVLADREIRLVMGEVAYVDSAFVGLVMLLRGHQARHGRRLQIVSIQKPVAQILTYCCADYLYSSPA